jgi:fatty acid desaturase
MTTPSPPPGSSRDAAEASRQARLCLVCLCGLYVVLGLALAGRLSPWVLGAAVPLLYARAALAVHELMHARSAAHVSPLHRLMMVLESPVCLGYREHRDVHLRHHRHTATEGDPEFFQIRGGHARAFLNALASPERAFVLWVRERGFGGSLARQGTVRFACFVLAAGLNPPAFLSYWVAVRLSVGVSSYVFHHVLHYRRGRYGTFSLRVSRPVALALRLVFGREGADIVLEHEAHHAFPGVRSRRLPGLVAAPVESAA